jgi:hypothetical protein
MSSVEADQKITYDKRFSILKMYWSFVKNHLSMLVICHILSTLYPRWKAVEMAKIRLSVGFTSSSSMFSTRVFCRIVSGLGETR